MRKFFYTEEEHRTASEWFFWMLVGLCILAYVGTNPAHQQNEYNHCAQHAKAVYEMGVEALTSPDKGQESAIYKSEEAKTEGQYLEHLATCNDLKAQWSVAINAHRAFWIGVIGILLVYRTFSASREAIRVTQKAADQQVIEAEKATAAAYDTVDVTREMGVAQARSYVDVFEVYCIGKPRTQLERQLEAKSVPAKVSGKTKLLFEFCIRNSGSIPAENVIVSYSVKASFSGNKPITSKATGITIGYIGPRSESFKISMYDCEIIEKKRESDELIIDLTAVIYSSDSLTKADDNSIPIILSQQFFGIYRTQRKLSNSGGKYITESEMIKDIAQATKT